MVKKNYLTNQKSAQVLLAKYGSTLVLTKKANGAMDYDTGLQTITETSRKATGVILDWTAEERSARGFDTNSKKVLLSATKLKADPDITETITIDSLLYNIRRVMKIQPRNSDRVVLYMLEVGV